MKQNYHPKIDYLNSLKNQLEWVKRQLEYLTYASSNYTNLVLKRGEVYEFDYGVNVNSEFSHRHFGVVLHDSNEENPLVLICPLKSNRYGAHPSSDVDLGFIANLNSGNKTLAVVNQIRALDKMRLYTKSVISSTGAYEGLMLSDQQMRQIISKLMEIIK
ncbi:MAG: type II toxin-antitoxin system PemK/MazF family toxin [Erysipelotrichaceae bacterium]|jgi:mRNA-degrading endonuclease toxin of MazEF toxin-antitoxin module|nr:type II toxin-antitoxin system PemK/MazF family toxin [Erysipelotrichaceae bacterium]